jgi:hypothetical protein
MLSLFSKTGAEFEAKEPGGEVMASGTRIDCRLKTLSPVFYLRTWMRMDLLGMTTKFPSGRDGLQLVGNV